MKEWLTVAFDREVVVRGLKVSQMVGTILVAINQGDAIIGGNLPAAAAWKIPLTYLVTYYVSTYAGVSAIMAFRDKNTDSPATSNCVNSCMPIQ